MSDIVNIQGKKMILTMGPKDTSLMVSLSEIKDALEAHMERSGNVLVNKLTFLRKTEGGTVLIIEELHDFEGKLEDVDQNGK